MPKASKKKTADLPEAPPSVQTPLINTSTIRKIRATYGDGVVITGRDIIDNPPHIFPLTPNLDIALNGGLVEGTLVVLAGKPRTGKTSTMLHFAKNWQQAGRRVAFLDPEHRLTGLNLKGTLGLNIDDILVIRSAKGSILSGQNYLDIARDILSGEEELLLILDSISIMSEERELTGGIGTETRGGLGKLLSQFCRMAAAPLCVNRHIVMTTAQLYANTSGMGKKFIAGMGNKMDYALSTLLYSYRAKRLTESGDEGEDIEESKESKESKGVAFAQVNFWSVERSPLGPPGVETKSYLRYGQGIDEVREYLEIARGLTLWKQNGAWCYYPDDENTIVRAQGLNNFRDAMAQNPDAFGKLKATVKGLVFDGK